MTYDPMPGEFNPYQAPASLDHALDSSGPLGDWLARPSPSLSRVRSGIGMICSGNFTLIAAIFSLAGSSLIPPVIAVSIVLLLIGCILILLGQLSCLAAPPESGARGVIYASGALLGLSLAAPFAGIYLGSFQLSLLATLILSAVAYLLFIVFVYQMARIIGLKSLIHRAKVVLAFAVLMTVLTAILIVGAFMTFPRMDEIEYWYFPFVSAALLFIGMYLKLLNDLSVMLRVRRVESEPEIIWPVAESQESSPDAQLPAVE